MKNNPRTIINVLFKCILESFNECKRETLLTYTGQIPKLSAIKDFQTLSLNLGRQRGHNSIIKTYALVGDIVICMNLDQVKNFIEYPFSAMTAFKFLEDYSFGEIRLSDETTIWINDYSHYSDDIRNKIDNALSEIVTENTIVKLG